MAASATFALKAGVWFRRGRLDMVSPDSQAQRACRQAEIPLNALCKIPGPALTGWFRKFRQETGGNTVIMFALSIVPIVGAVGADVDYSEANSIKSALQAAADSASLGTIKDASTTQSSQLQSKAQGIFSASFNRPNLSPIVSASYDAASNTVTVHAKATFTPNFMKVAGFSQINVAAISKATIGAKKWQVCVLVTEPEDNHTLMVKNDSQINFTNCMVQVNTQNWDAVEARDTSFIHSTNGVNCFVGDIHYGDVQPPKDPTCTLFPDPFASYTVPTNSCTFTNKVVTAPETLTPGTYCGGINIHKDVIFSPGVYYIQNGDLTITGTANVTADKVTFLITGASSNLNITTSGTLTMSPSTDAGQWSGFLFYYDQPSAISNKKSSKQGANWIKNAKLNGSGIIYLVSQKLNLTNNAVMNINPGSIIADFIVPDGGSKLNLTGTLNSPLAILNSMQKTGATSGGPVLVQ
jgi:Flp pilus assembly protein TadG